MNRYEGFPRQSLSYLAKNKKWREQCVNWGADRSNVLNNFIMRDIRHDKINYDLLNGKIDMDDVQLFVNPQNLDAGYIPDKIQHYPIMNAKLEVLRGEEAARPFDYKAIVTNPNAISQIEERKKQAVIQSLQQLIMESSGSEDEFNQKLEQMDYYFQYTYQDMWEIQGNELLNHYIKELNIKDLCHHGFMDAMATGKEFYRVYVSHGEPAVKRINPKKIRIWRSGYSNRIEDADVVVLDDYWSQGKIIDEFYDSLTPAEIKKIEDYATGSDSDDMDNIDESRAYVNKHMVSDVFEDNNLVSNLFFNDDFSELGPYDVNGNIRVCQVFWKSLRKMKDVKSFNPVTGEEEHNLYPETYVINKALGETERIIWINEAWEGTRIGSDIYVNIRPCQIQYNRLSNPSKCHFGIIGSIYNLNENKPFSMVDMMKPYNYYYDITYDRLNRMMARNWGKLVRLDTAKVPKRWTIDKWLYYAKEMGLAVEDSFNEGNYGAATGKLAGAMNNASSGVIDADFGNNIQQYINILEWTKNEMQEIIGISKQREGQISNRETVGGVERATLQSSHITEWLFIVHEDIRRRVIECVMDTAAICAKGKHNMKFMYITSDGSQRVANIDPECFAACDYGIFVDNSDATQKLNQQIETLAQAALQNQTLSFSTIMKLFSSASIAEKQRLVERDEQQLRAMQQQQQQQQLEQQQQIAQAQLEQKQAEMEQQLLMNQENNETKILVATIQANAKQQGQENDDTSELGQATLEEKKRQFNERLDLDKQRLAFDKDKAATDAELKRKQINKQKSQSK